ncbi:ABC transporter permease [Mycoplasma capricolum]|uniref:Membrane protein, putative n=1 Tax=Mycoplasma capricolum subsp. capricolum (strain California kid / ATCC 27343 / NCTC 10154) TaxID=340047 RepID=Q2SS49_MYCCT|nr:ABC transporter permease [Mycoplasma capricolum]ABC01827.1 membrane protein, putative [Mycoplasma capricolum subsp. capricolum ATCC 27343]
MFLAILPKVLSFNIQDLIPGIIASACPVVGIVSLSISFSDLKQTIIYKRIAVLPLKPWVFIISVISFFTILTWLSAIWVFIFSLIFWHSQINLTNIHTGYIILGVVFLSIICSSIGVIIGSLTKDYKIANAFSMMFYLLPAFLSGMYLPIKIIIGSNILKIVSLCLPYTYPVTIINYAWNKNTSNLIFTTQLWPFILISLLLVSIFITSAILIYKFKKKN